MFATGPVIGNAVKLMWIATGEEEEEYETESTAAGLGTEGWPSKGKKLSKQRRAEIAQKAAAKRWVRAAHNCAHI